MCSYNGGLGIESLRPKLSRMNEPPHDHPTAPARDARSLRRAALVAMAIVFGLWWLKLFEFWFDQTLTGLGIRPQNPWGLIGVLTAPLVHGSFEHLLSNSLPLVVLGTLAIWAYPAATRRALPLIWLVGGLGTWAFARPSVHLGASGVTHGLMFFLFVMGMLRWDRPAIATALITFLLYGGMLLTIFPREPHISFEYHFFGAVGGVLAALLWRKLDPRPTPPKYSWELEEEIEESLEAERDTFELPRPEHVPVLWQRPESDDEPKVIPFPRRGNGSDDAGPTRH